MLGKLMHIDRMSGINRAWNLDADIVGFFRRGRSRGGRGGRGGRGDRRG